MGKTRALKRRTDRADAKERALDPAFAAQIGHMKDQELVDTLMRSNKLANAEITRLEDLHVQRAQMIADLTGERDAGEADIEACIAQIEELLELLPADEHAEVLARAGELLDRIAPEAADDGETEVVTPELPIGNRKPSGTRKRSPKK